MAFAQTIVDQDSRGETEEHNSFFPNQPNYLKKHGNEKMITYSFLLHGYWSSTHLFVSHKSWQNFNVSSSGSNCWNVRISSFSLAHIIVILKRLGCGLLVRDKQAIWGPHILQNKLLIKSKIKILKQPPAALFICISHDFFTDDNEWRF